MGGSREKAFSFIEDAREEMVGFWEQLVNMESGTFHKEDVDKVALFLKDSVERFGGRARLVEFPDAGNALVAEFGRQTSKPHVCFLGHFDTVFPRGTVVRRPFRIEEGKAYGPGVLDMKSGVTIQLFAARALMEDGYSDRLIRIVLAGDEESMHPKSDMPRVFEEESRGAVAAFNFETGDVDNSLVVGRKGTIAYDIVVEGVSVHAGREPQKGRSAILEMARKIVDIQTLTDYDKGITFNVGTVKGGVVRNAVPDFAEIGVDVRVLENGQIDFVEEQIKRAVEKTYVEGTRTKYVRTIGMRPMPRTPGNERLFDFVSGVSEELGYGRPEPVVSGGGSDSAYSVAAGVPTIDQMGGKGEWNHSDREYAVVESLFERTRLAVACVLELDEFEKQCAEGGAK
jgi:glutamate carboxypeptidase